MSSTSNSEGKLLQSFSRLQLKDHMEAEVGSRTSDVNMEAEVGSKTLDVQNVVLGAEATDDTQRSRKMTQKGREYQMGNLDQQKSKLISRAGRKEAAINELLHSADNETTVREEMLQLNDLINLLLSIHGKMEEVDPEYNEEIWFTQFDENICTFKHKIHNWLKQLEVHDERRSVGSDNRSRSKDGSRSRRSRSDTYSSITSSSRKRAIEEKLKLAELEAEAAFMRKRTQIKMEAEELKIQENLVKTKGRLSILEQVGNDSIHEGPAKTDLVNTFPAMRRDVMLNHIQDDTAMTVPAMRVPAVTTDVMMNHIHNVPARRTNVMLNHIHNGPAMTVPVTTTDVMMNHIQNVPVMRRNPATRTDLVVNHIPETSARRRSDIMMNQAPITSSYQRRYEDSPDEAIRSLHQQRYEDYHSTTQQLCTLINQQSAPDVDIDVFNGNPIEYKYFISIFKEVVESRISDPMGRLTRLLKYTSGEAKDLIKHCINEEKELGYQQAMKLLEKQYGNPFKILAAYRQEIKKMAPVKPNDPAAFRKLYNFLLKCNSLNVDDNQNPLDTPDVICKILAKLPSYLQVGWGRNVLRMRKIQQKEPRLIDMLALVEEEMMICNDPLYSKEAMDLQKEKPERRFGKEKRISNFLIGASEEEKRNWRSSCQIVRKIQMMLRMLEKDQSECRLCYCCLKPISTNHNAATCHFLLVSVV